MPRSTAQFLIQAQGGMALSESHAIAAQVVPLEHASGVVEEAQQTLNAALVPVADHTEVCGQP